MHITGLHHVTALAGDPQRNLEFYVGMLGLRLVKRTVNFDDPGNYHFYFADGVGTPGSILTFFPWPHARRGQRGHGEAEATAFSVPRGSLGYWHDRLKAHGIDGQVSDRFGAETLSFEDPDGLAIEIVVSAENPAVQPWEQSPVPAAHALRGFHGVTLALAELQPTARFLTEVFGYRVTGESGDRLRLESADQAAPGRVIDLRPGGTRFARAAVGSVHHVAFRVPDDSTQASWRARLSDLGFGVSPVMDRTYFHSIYFREPGGVLFEIATDPPGFAVDEKPDLLGETLCLPSWLETSRPRVEAILPLITLPPARSHENKRRP